MYHFQIVILYFDCFLNNKAWRIRIARSGTYDVTLLDAVDLLLN